MYLPRTVEDFAIAASGQFPVLLVTGSRQVGKTTFLRHLSGPERTYVSLDDPLVLDLAKRDSALFMQRFRPSLLMDEIQYAPELLPCIKMEAGRTHQPGLVWLTGSPQFHLMRGVSGSLAGRVATVRLLGLSARETRGEGRDARPFLPMPETLAEREGRSPQMGLQDLYQAIWRGSYPAIVSDETMDWDLFYASCVRTCLQRDVRDLAQVGDEIAFVRFLRVAAARTGQILNVTGLARDSDVAVNTAKRWLSIAETSGIIYLLESYHTNLTKRTIKAPKLYFLDTGLCAYLAGWSSPATLEAGAMSGAILETWVVSEMLKGYLHNGKQPQLYYYRDRDRKEIDLLIFHDGVACPLEVKKTASPGAGDVHVLGLLAKRGILVGPGGGICLARQSLPLSPSAVSIPIGLL